MKPRKTRRKNKCSRLGERCKCSEAPKKKERKRKENVRGGTDKRRGERENKKKTAWPAVTSPGVEGGI